MEYQYISYGIRDRVGTITLNRPEKRNALNAEMVTELKAAFQETATDDRVKVVLLKANGKVFSAGADLGYLQQLQENSYEENLADSRHLMELFHMIYTLPKTVVAQIEGHAIAGGCGLATVCDISFTVPEAKFGYTEVKIGFVPAIVMLFLIRKTGEARAKQLLLSGELIDAANAVDMGMVNFLAVAETIEEKVWGYTQQLCTQNSGASMGITKQMIGKVQGLSLSEALEYAAGQNAKARATEDCKKGIQSFLDKEPVKW